MELIKFIRENNINNYEILKSILESETYNLKIKEDNDYPGLFLMSEISFYGCINLIDFYSIYYTGYILTFRPYIISYNIYILK